MTALYGHRTLLCKTCGAQYPGSTHRLRCDELHEATLLISHYSARQLNTHHGGGELSGLLKFSSWLPSSAGLSNAPGIVTYQSRGLAGELGLSNLYISFNGYFPEVQAQWLTGTFKELEAWLVLSWMAENGMSNNPLIMASAGSAARAFVNVNRLFGQALEVFVPHRAVFELWTANRGYLTDTREDVFGRNDVPGIGLVCTQEGSDYGDAMAASLRRAQEGDGFFEGGVWNPIRRDALGLTLVDAALRIGKIPDHYVQAVGSGAGAIGAWEMAERLREDGRFVQGACRLLLAQNEPFDPMVRAWRANRSILTEEETAHLGDAVNHISAMKLANRAPPYAVRGGVYDVLTASRGNMLSVTTAEAARSSQLFEAKEGIDIEPEAGIAVAALQQDVAAGKIGKNDVVLLNITGGGVARIRNEGTVRFPRVGPRTGVNSDLHRLTYEL